MLARGLIKQGKACALLVHLILLTVFRSSAVSSLAILVLMFWLRKAMLVEMIFHIHIILLSKHSIVKFLAAKITVLN